MENKILNDNWNIYYHLLDDKNWDINSYTLIIKNVNNVKDLILINENINKEILFNSMLFVMKSNILPTYEDNENINGGCFSYKILNEKTPIVWKRLLYSLCNNSIFINEKKELEKNINGITISPDRHFCIIKIWLKNCDIQDTNIVSEIPDLINGFFKKHITN